MAKKENVGRYIKACGSFTILSIAVEIEEPRVQHPTRVRMHIFVVARPYINNHSNHYPVIQSSYCCGGELCEVPRRHTRG